MIQYNYTKLLADAVLKATKAQFVVKKKGKTKVTWANFIIVEQKQKSTTIVNNNASCFYILSGLTSTNLNRKRAISDNDQYKNVKIFYFKTSNKGIEADNKESWLKNIVFY